MLKRFCDRPGCGKECPDTVTELHVHQAVLRNDNQLYYEDEMPNRRSNQMLCQECALALQTWFGADLGILDEDTLFQFRRQMEAEREAAAADKMSYRSISADAPVLARDH